MTAIGLPTQEGRDRMAGLGFVVGEPLMTRPPECSLPWLPLMCCFCLLTWMQQTRSHTNRCQSSVWQFSLHMNVNSQQWSAHGFATYKQQLGAHAWYNRPEILFRLWELDLEVPKCPSQRYLETHHNQTLTMRNMHEVMSNSTLWNRHTLDNSWQD